MAKTHAQRQKEYREKKKAELGREWLNAEKRRTKKYYVPIELLPTEKAENRRNRVKKNVRQFRSKLRDKKKECKTQKQNSDVNPAASSNVNSSSNDMQFPSTSSHDLQTPAAPQKMIVKLPGVASRTRVSRQVASQKRVIRSLKDVNESLKKKNASLRKANSRLKQKSVKSLAYSPRSKAEKSMRDSGISPRKHPDVAHQLLFKNVLEEEIKESVSQNPGKTGVIKKVVAGEIIRKYGLVKHLGNSLKLHLRRATDLDKNIEMQKRKMKSTHAKLCKDVKEFLEREDNSRQLPGKADAVKGEKPNQKIQKYVLNDYLHNLHLKFMGENPNQKMCLATFCNLRPKHISLVNFTSRSTCLCTKHQNFSLKLQSLKTVGVTSETSPDKFVESTEPEKVTEILSEITVENVHYKEWKRVKCNDGKQRTKLLDFEKTKDEFTDIVELEYSEFRGHISRVKAQYEAFKTLKDKVYDYSNHVCVQMDFAENYSIKEMEEVQSAYFNAEMVTLHPVVIYYKTEDELLNHKSYVVVSEVLEHNATMVLAIIDKVMVKVKEICPAVEFIHYWTDSPTSQYRNKTIFDLVARHSELYDVKASWQYFESGHGKGACDGIGGVAKRSADNAMRSGKVTLQSARDFYNWASSTDSNISYIYIDRDEFEASRSDTETRKSLLMPVKGTLKTHSVYALDEHNIMTRETTCCCPNCFTATGFGLIQGNKCNWQSHTVSKSSVLESQDIQGSANDVPNDQNDTEPVTTDGEPVHNDTEPVPTDAVQVPTNAEAVPTNTEPVPSESEPVPTDTEPEPTDTEPVPIAQASIETTRTDIQEGTFVIALYEQRPYVGKVVDMDEEEFEITFMESGSKVQKSLKWPRVEDKLWVSKQDVMCKVQEPQAIGKGKRTYRLVEEDSLKFQEIADEKMNM